MNREVLMCGAPDACVIAIVENGELCEFYRENDSSMGSVYVGKVSRYMPDLHAAFVDIGQELAAFLGEDDAPSVKFKDGQTLLVQVKRPAKGLKGARLTTNIALPSRKIVYLPNGRGVSVSQKLPESERARLKAACEGIPDGVILRTACEGAESAEILADIHAMREVWRGLTNQYAADTQPRQIYGETLLARAARDLMSDEVSRVIVEGDELYGSIKALNARQMTRYDGPVPLFAVHRINEKALGQRRAWLKCGGFIVRDQAEAMTVFDVNSGKSQDSLTVVNVEAAREIVRQIRLNDIGGLIVIDFIDGERAPVEAALRDALSFDRARGAVYGFTAMGLYELSRKRVQ